MTGAAPPRLPGGASTSAPLLRAAAVRRRPTGRDTLNRTATTTDAPARGTRARPRPTSAPRRAAPDLLAVLTLSALTLVGWWDVLRPGATTVGLDLVAFFYPMFSFLGERLAAGDVPGWNPYQFAGAPFAADPESGWTYLPAMLPFALLPLGAAARAFVLVHLALAGGGLYALARALGIAPVGALVAAVALVQGGFLSDRGRCCPAHVQVVAWLPLLLLGLELALRAPRWPARLACWTASGLALSQVLAAWLGQGAYYALLALGAFAAYRCLIDPPAAMVPLADPRRLQGRHLSRPDSDLAQRLVALIVHGGAVLAIGFGLAAAGILPRLAYHARSNLAEGYAGRPELAWAAAIGGWHWRRASELLLERGGWYVGGAALALALAAPFLVRWRHATPLWAALALAALALTIEPATPLRPVLYAVLPRFGEFHEHRPERVLAVAYPALALLAGTSVGALRRATLGRRSLLLAAGVPALVPAVLAAAGVPPARPVLAAWLAAALALPLALAALRPAPARRLVPGLLVLLVFADFFLGARRNVADGLFTTLDLSAFAGAADAAAFLRSRPDEPPDRFFGYDPALRSDHDGQTSLYRHEYRDPRTAALLVNNRATLLRLPDVQGYDPIQPRRYVEFMAALNGHPQEYHGAYVFPAGLGSPLLDLLNARYVVLPAVVPPDRPDLNGLLRSYPQVHAGTRTRVLQNPEALPRAWLVHDARRVEPGAALPLLASGAVDPRRTALLETAPPTLAPPRDPTADSADIAAYEPERLLVRTRSDAPALLVLAEGYDPGWTATVDGQPAPVLPANHALRAIPVPAGAHAVELRYRPPGLGPGLVITGATACTLVAGFALAGWQRVGRRRRV